MPTKTHLFAYFRRNWFRYLIGIVLVFASTWFAAQVPRLLGEAIDLLRDGEPMSAVRFAALLLALAAFAAFAFRFLWRYLVLGFCRGAETYMRRVFFAHLETLSADFYIKYNTGDIITRGISDINGIRRMFGGAGVGILNALVTFALAAYNMFNASGPVMAGIAIAPIPFLLIFIMKLRPHLKARQSDIRAATSAMASKVQENLTGIRVVKAFAREEGESERFEKLSRGKWASEVRRVKLAALVGPIIQIVYGAVFTVFIVYGSRRMAAGLMSLGDFTAFNGYILMMIGPIGMIGGAIGEWQTGLASIARLDEMLLYKPSVADRAGLAEEWAERKNPLAAGVASDAADRWISLRNLTFSYPGVPAETPPVLQNISVDIVRGETLAITGPTGCGKSTLLSLLSRLWAVPEGEIAVAGLDVNDIPLNALRDAIGYVPQDNFLFSDSILENIRFFADGVTDDDVFDAARAVSVHDNITEFARGYETTVGERGVTLSGGQMQRIAIARALVRRPRILLLDDCLSAVDAETERAILSGLRGYLDGATAIIVTHRVAAAALADRVLVLNEQGGVAELGTYDELMAKRGALFALAELQAGAESEITGEGAEQ
ncbi:MAG: ABC transporter ATP-binding protein/permease [Oscillospiraceae bacterium]|nr:ABC transporter ATP-binding protein/permease [Oscillospiraceae bacterium]